MDSASHEAKAEDCREVKLEGIKPSSPETAGSKTEPDAKAADRSDSKKGTKEKAGKKRRLAKGKKSKSKKSAKNDSESDEESSASPSTSPTSDEDTSEESESESESESEGEMEKHHPSKRTNRSSKSQSNQRNRKSRSAKSPISSDSSESELSDSDCESSSESGCDGDKVVDDDHDKDSALHQMQLQLMQLDWENRLRLGGGNRGLGYGGGYTGNYAAGLQYDGTHPLFDPRNAGGPFSRRGGKLLPRGGGRAERAIRGGRAPTRRGTDAAATSSDRKKRQKHKKKGKRRNQTKLDFKRVDQVWDDSIHNYKLQDTAEAISDSEYDEFLFHIRRTFDWEGKHKATYADIKSKLLKECLRDVIGNIKGVSLVEETPKLDPNLLFLYLEDIRKYYKDLKKKKPKASGKKERKKEAKRMALKRKHVKVLIKYLDKDYAQVKKSLYPMLENGLITFDLLWALWKPDTLAYTNTYGSPDEHRVFKVEAAEKHCSIMKGTFYYIEGKYFDYDGKQFGFGSIAEEIGDFRGARKITSLEVFPLQYLKNKDEVRHQLIERGKKFVSLAGVHYRSHQGMAYIKKRKTMVKVNINGRIMVDSNIHRRINPNYPISLVKPKDDDTSSDYDSDDSSYRGDSNFAPYGGNGEADKSEAEEVKYVTKVFQDKKGNCYTLRVPDDEAGPDGSGKLELVESKQGREGDDDDDGKGGTDGNVKSKDKECTEVDAKPDSNSKEEEKEEKIKEAPQFSDEEYLIASPVVLGFSFAEKLWLEFTVSGVKEIQWNEQAYESLVLGARTKDIVKALVESHKYHAAESIDDVIQGKGKGLVAVLHGPPGTGKTLTAEGISELLKCPLYMVSAGELGTDSRYLEMELQKILDICHAWGAILLLDEADVFLEKRNMHDIHRNALVSIFLRQLEYFQGILFLTTNRVETFDEAFQSRIHIALRYDSLDSKAKKSIFKLFIERVRVLEKLDVMPFTEEDYSALARYELNGRQIKNTVRTAQALAVNKHEPLSMKHIRQVVDVHASFDRDLKGGTGYQDAMRSYF